MAEKGGHWVKSAGGGSAFVPGGAGVAKGASDATLRAQYDKMAAQHDKLIENWGAMTVSQQWALHDKLQPMVKRMKLIDARLKQREKPKLSALEKAQKEYDIAYRAYSGAGWNPGERVVSRLRKAQDALRKAKS